jgi:hypothetical protein
MGATYSGEECAWVCGTVDESLNLPSTFVLKTNASESPVQCSVVSLRAVFVNHVHTRSVRHEVSKGVQY